MRVLGTDVRPQTPYDALGSARRSGLLLFFLFFAPLLHTSITSPALWSPKHTQGDVCTKTPKDIWPETQSPVVLQG